MLAACSAVLQLDNISTTSILLWKRRSKMASLALLDFFQQILIRKSLILSIELLQGKLRHLFLLYKRFVESKGGLVRTYGVTLPITLAMLRHKSQCCYALTLMKAQSNDEYILTPKDSQSALLGQRISSIHPYFHFGDNSMPIQTFPTY